MAVTGDFRKLEDLIRRTRSLGDRRFRAEMSQQLGHEALALTQNCFEAERDPYGRRWPPLKNPGRRRRGGRILRDTARLVSSINMQSSHASFRLQTSVRYAAIHNFGGSVGRSRGQFNYHRRKGRKAGRFVRAGTVGAKVSYAKPYSIGIPRRMFIPEPGRIPPRWQAAFIRTGRGVFRDYFGGVR